MAFRYSHFGCFSALFLSLFLTIPSYAQAPIPLAIKGLNQDVVYENANPSSVTAYFDTPVGGRNNWIANGVNGAAGLVSGTFSSAATNTVTGGHTAFTLASFTGNNVLLLTQSAPTGTLTFTGAFTSLAIAASSANAGALTASTLTLNFAGGVTVPGVSFNAFDWVAGNGSSHDILSTNLDRSSGDASNMMSFGSANSIPIDSVNHPNIFETDIDLTNINGTDYSRLSLTGITFNIVSTDTEFKSSTGIFAVSGIVQGQSINAVEPGSLGLIFVFLLPAVRNIRWSKF